MNKKTDPADELHGAMVALLNESEASDACKLSALVRTVVVAILAHTDSQRSAVRMSGTVFHDITTLLGDQLPDHGNDPIDNLKGNIGDIGQMRDKRGPLN